jgi:GT2 family glycosyltransferase
MRYALNSGYDYVFLLNQDAWLVKPNTIEKLIVVQKNNPEYVIINPVHLYANEKRISMFRKHFTDINTPENDIISDLLLRSQLKEVYEIYDVGATAWLLPIDIIKNIGGFDPLFFHYGEDDNYMQRVRYHYPEAKIGLSLDAFIVHDIEDRGRNYGKENNNWQKSLLVEFANVNGRNEIKKRKKKTLIKFFQKLFFLRIESAKSYFLQYRFLKEKEKLVQNSLIINKKRGANWL